MRSRSGHDLGLMARELWTASADRDRLCVCSPETRADPASDGTGPWRIKGLRFPDHDQAFAVEVVFSLDGKAFLVNLARTDNAGDVADVDIISRRVPDEPCRVAGERAR